jgi:16S rRNA processing protein RimM
MSCEFLQIGAVCRPHGLRGELRVRLHDPSSSALDELTRIFIGQDRGEVLRDETGLRAFAVRTARRQDEGFYLLILDGLSHRDAADGLRGQVLYARRDELPQLDEDEVYLADLVGCRVIDMSGQEIGLAKAVQDIAGNLLLVVQRPRRDDALVPLVPEILVEVDLEARLLRIDPPEGLLDLDLRAEAAPHDADAAP